MTSILLDARILDESGGLRGIGRYVQCLLEELSGFPDVTVAALADPETELPRGVVRMTSRPVVAKRWGHIERRLRLPLDIRRSGCDVFHSPAFDPVGRTRRPWVQTLHDVIPLVIDHPHFVQGRPGWLRMARRLRWADAVIANSRHTADQATERLGLDPTRVHVAHLGVGPAFVPAAANSQKSAAPPYVLFVAGYGPHKGHAGAFEVIARLASIGLPHRLKVVGPVPGEARETLFELMRQAPRQDRIDLLGAVSDSELVELYQRASALLITSEYEGFCLPAVEAMATATPVVSFDSGAIPEVVGDAALLISDRDLDSITDALAEVVAPSPVRDRLVKAGLERATGYTWKRCAGRHLEIYRSVTP